MNELTSTYEQIARAAGELTHEDKVRLMEYIRLALEREQLAQAPTAPGWPPGFFERTYGSLADDPIERPPQGEYEERDEIE